MYISKRSGMDHTVLPANTPCLPFLRMRSPDGATSATGRAQDRESTPAEDRHSTTEPRNQPQARYACAKAARSLGRNIHRIW